MPHPIAQGARGYEKKTPAPRAKEARAHAAAAAALRRATALPADRAAEPTCPTASWRMSWANATPARPSSGSWIPVANAPQLIGPVSWADRRADSQTAKPGTGIELPWACCTTPAIPHPTGSRAQSEFPASTPRARGAWPGRLESSALIGTRSGLIAPAVWTLIAWCWTRPGLWRSAQPAPPARFGRRWALSRFASKPRPLPRRTTAQF